MGSNHRVSKAVHPAGVRMTEAGNPPQDDDDDDFDAMLEEERGHFGQKQQAEKRAAEALVMRYSTSPAAIHASPNIPSLASIEKGLMPSSSPPRQFIPRSDHPYGGSPPTLEFPVNNPLRNPRSKRTPEKSGSELLTLPHGAVEQPECDRVLVPCWERWLSVEMFLGFLVLLGILALAISQGFTSLHVFIPGEVLTSAELYTFSWVYNGLDISGMVLGSLYVLAGLFVAPKLRMFPLSMMFSWNLCTVIRFIVTQVRFTDNVYWCQVQGFTRNLTVTVQNTFVFFSVVNMCMLVFHTRSTRKWKWLFLLVGWIWPALPAALLASMRQYVPTPWPGGCEPDPTAPIYLYAYALPVSLFTPACVIMLSIVSRHIIREVRLHPFTNTATLLKTLLRFQLFVSFYTISSCCSLILHRFQLFVSFYTISSCCSLILHRFQLFVSFYTIVILFLVALAWVLIGVPSTPPVFAVLYEIFNRSEVNFYPLIWGASSEVITAVRHRTAACRRRCRRHRKTDKTDGGRATPQLPEEEPMLNETFDNLSDAQRKAIPKGALISMGIQTAI
ncbi:hypothetical protein PAPYR_11232 [Paratrimastix pyriformis]|uniref:Uncharacterized protein n=1 Tax=Paratrimastix pyriformis TaxID=342808 RepID=A0ABQ8U4A2_9EUKA|nr:hypothetical protein PAPYR_11232 [Paratrimastix pyriformis]